MCSLNTHTLTHTHKHTHGANAVLVWSGEDPAHWPHLGSEPAQMPQWETTTDSQKEGGTQVIHDWINCRDSRSDGDILDDFCLTNGLTVTLFFHNLLKSVDSLKNNNCTKISCSSIQIITISFKYIILICHPKLFLHFKASFVLKLWSQSVNPQSIFTCSSREDLIPHLSSASIFCLASEDINKHPVSVTALLRKTTTFNLKHCTIYPSVNPPLRAQISCQEEAADYCTKTQILTVFLHISAVLFAESWWIQMLRSQRNGADCVGSTF